MFPAQTSMIPVQVALARFMEQGGNIFGDYPYWYLGTTPFRYLTGPILPSVLALLHRVLPNLSLFEIMFGLIGVMWVAGGMGVYWLVKELANSSTSQRRSPPSEESIRPPRRRFALVVAVFYLFGPIVPFLFRFSDGLYLIAFSFLPFVLLMYLRLLKKWTLERALSCGLLIAFVILLNLAVVPSMLLGMAAIFLVQVGWKKAEKKLENSLVLLFFSFLVVTLWYTPGYWLTSLTGPSLAGKGRLGVIFQVSKLLPTALAFALAIFSVRFFKKRHLLRDFCFYWLFIFGFLTLMRFIADPDFWLDWMSYGTEIQMGVAMALGLGLSRMKAKRIFCFVVCCLLFVVWLLVANKYVFGTLQSDVTQTVEYHIGKQLSEIAKGDEKALLSGTTAFWLNAFFDISQVRGGVDQASVHPDWRRAAWEIREGTEVEKSLKWLRALSVSYLVVHTEDSEEFYHDFTYPEKFETAVGLKKIYDEGGDKIYKVL